MATFKIGQEINFPSGVYVIDEIDHNEITLQGARDYKFLSFNQLEYALANNPRISLAPSTKGLQPSQLATVRTYGQLVPFIALMVKATEILTSCRGSYVLATYQDDNNGLWQYSKGSDGITLSYTERTPTPNGLHGFELGRTYTADYLKKNGINKLESVLSSHLLY